MSFSLRNIWDILMALKSSRSVSRAKKAFLDDSERGGEGGRERERERRTNR